MAPPQVVDPAIFDISKVKLGAIKTLDNNCKIVSVLYDDKPFMVQTPKLSSPYGVNRFDDKLTLDLSFGVFDDPIRDGSLGPDDKRMSFFKMVAQLQKMFVESALDNSNAWFKKKHSSIDVIEALHTPQIKYSKDKETGEFNKTYPPTFKIKLPSRDGANTFQTYNADREPIEFDSIDIKGGDVVAIVQCTGIWVAGGKFGCSWRTVQMKVFPNTRRLPPCAFKSDPEEAYGIVQMEA